MLDENVNKKPQFLEKNPIVYKTESERISSGREDLWSKVGAEQKEAKEKFSEIISYVDNRYENPDSFLFESPVQLETFKKHNEQILNRAIEQGIRKGMDQNDLAKLEIAAILHDLNKGDKTPKWAEGIDNFMLVYHGEAAAQEITNNEELRELIKDKLGAENIENDIRSLQKAIRSHMGPHPGFMSGMLEMVNNGLVEKGLEELEHPYPDEEDDVAKVLLAADMYSLASHKGVEKVMAIRNNIDFFKQQDRELSQQYKEAGISLSMGEAALLSAFDSAYSARDMIKDQEDKKWIQGVINKAVEMKYRYQKDDTNLDEMVSIELAQQKRKEFEDRQRSKNISNSIQNVI